MKISRRILFAVMLLGSLSLPALAQQKTLHVVSGGGALQAAQREAFWKPYEQETGVKIIEDSWNGELAKVRAMVENKNVTWDIIFGADMAHGLVGCDQGFLAKLDKTVTGDPADYLPGTLNGCAVASDLSALLFAYNEAGIPASWGNNRPATLMDFFDTKRFPGKRGIRNIPKGTLEQALMADGVPPANVYNVLGGPGGVERALKKLDTIKADTVYFNSLSQATQLLADKQVALVFIYNGRVFAANKEGQKFVPLWDHLVFVPDGVIVPKGPNTEEALKLLAYTMRPEVQARLARYIPYGSARRSAVKLVDPKLAADLPTSPDNSKNGLARNEAWWADHGDEVNAKWASWLSK